MRELQIELCPDRAERRKRARKIASFSAEKRAKGEIAIYAKAVKLAASRTKKMPPPPPPPRAPRKGSVVKIDKLLVGKIEKLAKNGGIPTKLLKLRLSRAKLALKGASSADNTITLGASGSVRDIKMSDLHYIDRASLSALLNEKEPENKGLYGVTAFYLECCGETKMAATYYEKAGKEMKVKFGALFESEK